MYLFLGVDLEGAATGVWNRGCRAVCSSVGTSTPPHRAVIGGLKQIFWDPQSELNASALALGQSPAKPNPGALDSVKPNRKVRCLPEEPGTGNHGFCLQKRAVPRGLSAEPVLEQHLSLFCILSRLQELGRLVCSNVHANFGEQRTVGLMLFALHDDRL